MSNKNKKSNTETILLTVAGLFGAAALTVLGEFFSGDADGDEIEEEEYEEE